VKLPNCEQAVVPREKITDYLLSIDHQDGGPKAAYFLRFGFRVDAWDEFAAALRRHAYTNDVAAVTPTSHGEVYRVEGPFDTPDGRQPYVRSIWIVGRGADAPTLVTAYPLGRRQR
jgi:hypothetical protein